MCVVDTGNYFKKRCLHQTLEFEAEASVMCMCGVFLIVPVVCVYICPYTSFIMLNLKVTLLSL